jgi:uncharacterized protein
VVDSYDISSIVDTVLIKVASRCNINCSYCYVFNMGDDRWRQLPKVMSNNTMDAISTSLGNLAICQRKPFSVVLHGGEPLLLGIDRLEYLLSGLRNSLPVDYPISMQTNGILLSPEILDICSRYRTSIAISIDGPRTLNDKMRIGHRGEATYDKALRGYELLQSHHDALFLNTGLLAVIDPSSDPSEVYHFFKALSPPSVDFLYKDGNHSKLPIGKVSPYSTEYGSWMLRLLQAYLSDLNPLPIRILDDMLKVILGGVVTKEGVGVTNFGILIVDTDGRLMKNDTLKSTYPGADSFGSDVNIKDANLVEFLHSDEFRKYKEMQRPTCHQCVTCPELKICGGGMSLHRWREDNGYDNESIYCADQLYLIAGMKKMIARYTVRP